MTRLELDIQFARGWNQTTAHPLPTPEAIDIALSSCETLDEAYRQGISLARLWIEMEDGNAGTNVHNGNNAVTKT